MGWKTPSPRSVFIAWAAGCAATVLLVWTWHAVGLASRPSSAGYTYSQYLTTCVSWPFVLSFLALGGMLGLAFQQAWAAALGLVTPLPAAVVIEFVQDRTSHNLLPFEFLFYWCPALILAAGGVLAGWALRRAMMRWRGGPHFLRR